MIEAIIPFSKLHFLIFFISLLLSYLAYQFEVFFGAFKRFKKKFIFSNKGTRYTFEREKIKKIQQARY